MAKITDDTIGIGISKTTLGIHRLSDAKTMSFGNCITRFRSLAQVLRKDVCEARILRNYWCLSQRALGADLRLVKVNPLQARRFAKAQGVRAKTDAVDAKIPAKVGNALEPDEPAPKIQHDLKELRAFRSGLIKDRTSIMNRLKTQTLSIICRQSKTRLAQVDEQVAEISAEVDRLINANNILAHSMKIFRSIPGICAVCAATILIEMPEVGKLDRRQVASLTRLAPIVRQSGNGAENYSFRVVGKL